MQISSRLMVLAGLSLALLLPSALGHGRLVTPVPRDVYVGKASDATQNAPVDGTTTAFVCRNYAKAAPTLTITAGQTFTVKWQFDANHVGDSFLYLSYDIDKADALQEYFKIAQFPKSNVNNGVAQTVTAPAWLKPCDHCILRFEWYALHVWAAGTVELYSQCVDVKIVGPANGVLGTPREVIPGHLPTTDVKNKYREPFDPASPFFYTGPALAVADGTVEGIDSGSSDSGSNDSNNSTSSASSASSDSSSSKKSSCGGISKDGVAAVSVILTALFILGTEFFVYWLVTKKGVSLSLPRGKAATARSTSPI